MWEFIACLWKAISALGADRITEVVKSGAAIHSVKRLLTRDLAPPSEQITLAVSLMIGAFD
jgi:hypothetical protein